MKASGVCLRINRNKYHHKDQCTLGLDDINYWQLIKNADSGNSVTEPFSQEQMT